MDIFWGEVVGACSKDHAGVNSEPDSDLGDLALDQHEHHLETCWKCTFLDPTLDLLYQKSRGEAQHFVF